LQGPMGKNQPSSGPRQN